MLIEYLVHLADVFIDRNNENWPTKAVCFDSDGNHLHKFPLDMTDDQIAEAICFANKAYKQGMEYGEKRKATQLRMVLGFEN